jgi:hypothetical protein
VIDLNEIRKLSRKERVRLIEAILQTLEEEDGPGVPMEPFHQQAVWDELEQARRDGDPGQPVEVVVERILSKR